METGMALGADAAMSEATKTRMLTATGLLLMEALGAFRGTRKMDDLAYAGNAEHRA